MFSLALNANLLTTQYAHAQQKPKDNPLVFSMGEVSVLDASVVHKSLPEPIVVPVPPPPPPPPVAKPTRKATDLAPNPKSHQGFTEGQWAGWCVTFAKNYTGVHGTWGNGGRKLPLSPNPQIGAVVVFTYTHVAVIVDIQGDYLVLIESNYGKSMRITIGRTIKIGDPTIRGFFIP